MQIKEFNKDFIKNEINEFSGLTHIGNGINNDIENYYHSFMDWLNQNDVLEIIDQYANVQINLDDVTSHDFLIWLLHYGDVYDNLLRHCLEINPTLDYKRYAIEFFNLRQLHPKFSFTVALSSQMTIKKFLSDNDLANLTNLLNSIPDNSHNSHRDYQASIVGNELFDALIKLSNFATERIEHINN
ncbi:hypothetical protein [Companilactobacillus kimchiensis]|uniref:Uncharacterized protein n=1 Tax=Companilactobacillus kimchiensis TaxID=993692 RepID=A0A0R2LFJ8_9LACO|nr:hypothetical protein [Companilactobacillus kimchiensis]KRO00590.1 hypothetical protein IV57_GL001027 [Companilactobacillus kimchiensis]